MTSVALKPPKKTPMMEQWHRLKQEAKEAILLFRMGDFYEAFYEDAELISQLLDLTLTKRQGIPMSGVPWHTSATYIDRLISKGCRVAVAEQVEDPKTAKGLVDRRIVRFVTPGTVVHSNSIAENTNNYIISLTRVGATFGLATLDLTTGSFQVTELEETQELLDEIMRLQPTELLSSKKFLEKHAALIEEIKASLTLVISTQKEWYFDHKMAYAFLTGHFKVQHLDGFGLQAQVAAINAAGALLSYIQERLSLPINHIGKITPYCNRDVLSIDRVSQCHLELTESLTGRGRKNTLLSVIDRTVTPMGGRQLREWLKKPLLLPHEIIRRHDAVEALMTTEGVLASLREHCKGVRDLERLMTKVSTKYATPRDILALVHSLEKVLPIKNLMNRLSSELLLHLAQKLVDLRDVIDLVTRVLVEEPPLKINEGNIFRRGVHPPLDELREISKGGKKWLANYQLQLQEETGIKTLKVGFNRVFGYFIEVSKKGAERMPTSFQRRQTLTNSERFISPRLKEHEEKVFSAEERMQAMEEELFQKLCERIVGYEREIFEIAHTLAQLDALHALAETARVHNYCRPVIDETKTLSIHEGSHPVISVLTTQESFIPNDTYLNGESERMLLLTGPNMGGKSTYLRQICLIVILAQMGSFVPAKAAHIGVIDKIFTRIGASDHLARGQSTFMVEMSETANILHNVTSRSLVILDEIGRGTSTYDGVSIAWAVAEYLLTTKGKGAKTLFATHYGELTELERLFSSVLNYHTKVEECGKEIVFLHKIERGSADRSYGIHVARLAGLPLSVISRAEVILKELEANTGSSQRATSKKESSARQLTLF